MSDDSQIIVEPAGGAPQQVAAWTTVVGPEAMDFLSIVVPEASRDQVRDAAISILARAVPPAAPAGQETGLVVGYVQSGKTMSFEAVAAGSSQKNSPHHGAEEPPPPAKPYRPCSCS
jgi:hypothetical protein